MQVKIRLTGAEFEAVQAAAFERGVNVQRHIVEIVLPAVAEPPPATPTVVRLPALTVQQRALVTAFQATRSTLAGAANNLNQLTRWSHAHEEAAEGIEEAIAKVNDAAKALGGDIDALVADLRRDDRTKTPNT